MRNTTAVMLTVIIFTAIAQPIQASGTEPELIYSSYTNSPSFYCPADASKCVLYQTTNRWSQLDDPVLRDECGPGGTCSFLSASRRGNSIRWLPGDIWTTTALFEGYKLYDDSLPLFSQPDEPEEGSEDPGPQPEPQCTKKECTRKSIHGICMSYRMVCSN